MPGSATPWQLLQISTTTASLTCWWAPRWRTSTGAPSMSTMVMASTSPTTTSRYLVLVYLYLCACIRGFFFSNCHVLLFLVAAYRRLVCFPNAALLWPQPQRPPGLGWRRTGRLGCGSPGQRRAAQVRNLLYHKIIIVFLHMKKSSHSYLARTQQQGSCFQLAAIIRHHFSTETKHGQSSLTFSYKHTK